MGVRVPGAVVAWRDFVRGDESEAPPAAMVRLAEATPASHQLATVIADVTGVRERDGHHHELMVARGLG